MITGGRSDQYQDSSEVLDIENESVTMASQMKSKGTGHGMGVVTINGENRLAVFGGNDGIKKLDSIELYNCQSKKWEIADIKLKEPHDSSFCFLSIKLSDIISEV